MFLVVKLATLGESYLIGSIVKFKNKTFIQIVFHDIHQKNISGTRTGLASSYCSTSTAARRWWRGAGVSTFLEDDLSGWRKLTRMWSSPRLQSTGLPTSSLSCKSPLILLGTQTSASTTASQYSSWSTPSQAQAEPCGCLRSRWCPYWGSPGWTMRWYPHWGKIMAGWAENKIFNSDSTIIFEGSWWPSKTSGDGERSSSCLVTVSSTRSTTASLTERTGGFPLRFLLESSLQAPATVWPAPLPGSPGDHSTRRWWSNR